MLKRKSTQNQQSQELVTVEDVEKARQKLASDIVTFWRTVQGLDAFEPSESMLSQAEETVRRGIKMPNGLEPSRELQRAMSDLAITLACAYAARSKLLHERALLSQPDFERARSRAIELVNAAFAQAVEGVVQARQAEAQRLGRELVQAVREKIEALKSSVAPEVWDLYLALERRGVPNTPRRTRLESAAALILTGNWSDRLLRGEKQFVYYADLITDGAASRILKQRQELSWTITAANLLGTGFWTQLT